MQFLQKRFNKMSFKMIVRNGPKMTTITVNCIRGIIANQIKQFSSVDN